MALGFLLRLAYTEFAKDEETGGSHEHNRTTIQTARPFPSGELVERAAWFTGTDWRVAPARPHETNRTNRQRQPDCARQSGARRMVGSQARLSVRRIFG